MRFNECSEVQGKRVAEETNEDFECMSGVFGRSFEALKAGNDAALGSSAQSIRDYVKSLETNKPYQERVK